MVPDHVCGDNALKIEVALGHRADARLPFLMIACGRARADATPRLRLASRRLAMRPLATRPPSTGLEGPGCIIGVGAPLGVAAGALGGLGVSCVSARPGTLARGAPRGRLLAALAIVAILAILAIVLRALLAFTTCCLCVAIRVEAVTRAVTWASQAEDQRQCEQRNGPDGRLRKASERCGQQGGQRGRGGRRLDWRIGWRRRR